MANSTGALGPGTALTIDAGAFLDTNGSSFAIPILSGAGTITTTYQHAGTDTLTVGSPTGSTFSGVIAGGTGTAGGYQAIYLYKVGPGVLILTGSNTYTGGTYIKTGGALQVGNGGTTGSLPPGSINNNGTLTYDRSDNITIANLMTGSGSFTQAGSGTVTLTAANTYSVGTTVASGTLLLANATGSATGPKPVTVDSGATLAGTGTATGTITVNSGGTLSPGIPGSSTGILTIGTLTLASGSNLDIAINSATAGTGYDKLNVTNAATIVGSNLILTGSSTLHNGAAFDVCNATTGITGTFTSLANGGTVTLNSIPLTAAYATGSLTLTANLAGSATSVTASTNPIASGNNVTFTATVTSPESGTPTGTVTFLDGTTTLGTATLNGSAQATFADSTLPLGSNAITAVYTGDANFTGSTSSSLAETVNSAGPAAPTNLYAYASAATEIDLYWTNNATNATAIDVYRSTDDATFSLVATIDPSSENNSYYADTGLSIGTTYYYEVKAINAGGASSPASANATTNPLSNFTATGASADEIDLSWTAGPVVPTEIEIDFSGSGFAPLAGSLPDGNFPGDTTSYQYTDPTLLSPDAQYSFTIEAFLPDGTETAPLLAYGSTLPPTPTGLTAEGVSTSEIDLSWDADPSGIAQTEVYRSTDGVNYSPISSALATGTTYYQDTGLADDTSYDYEIKSMYPDGSASVLSSPVSASTLPAITDLAANPVSSSEIDLAWTTGIGNATAIQVQRTGSTGSPVTTALDATATTYNDTSLDPGSAYTYQVNAITASGASEEVSTATATTVGAVTGLTATAVSTGQINLGWTTNVSNVAELAVYRSTDGGAYEFLTDSYLSDLLTPTSTTFTDYTAEGHDYSYEIQTTTSDGTVNTSDPADAQTLPIENLTYTPTTTGITLGRR
jgi:autotransporter-associated beta strand protein